MFNDTNIVEISDLVKDQFPAFYKKQGENFIAFLKAYYEWLQQPDNPIYVARNRYKQFDIDTAAEEFLSHYRNKYMWGLPPELLGNQRLLQKHIIELYRSKGSQEAIRLLFRLLFNEDIEFYIPSYDIFKLSDNTWLQPHYLEVTNSTESVKLIGHQVTGSLSGATAVVENYQQRFINGEQSYVLFISNIKGEWIIGDALFADNIDRNNAPLVIGSVVGLEIVNSSPNVEIGDTLVATVGEMPIIASISDVQTGSGVLSFELLDGGTYYSLDTIFVENKPKHEDLLLPVANLAISASSYGFPKNPAANVDSTIKSSLYLEEFGDYVIDSSIPVGGGTGIQLKVLSLSNTQIYQYNTDLFAPYSNTAVNAPAYGFPKFPNSNTATIINNSLGYSNVTVGTIATFQVLNPGSGYSNPVEIIPIDPYTSTSGIQDANGNFVGMNAKIIGTPISGDNLASGLVIQDSGLNNRFNTPIIFVDQNNPSLTVTAKPIIGAIGHSQGFYENTKSFLSDDKYLFDGHYYQDFSYVIKASMNLEEYINILKQLAHPAGNAVFGDVTQRLSNQLLNNVVGYAINISPVDPGYKFVFTKIDNVYENIQTKDGGVYENISTLES